MKSNDQQLANRGFLIARSERDHFDKSFEQQLELLQSQQPVERTLGARLLGLSQNVTSINYLIDALKIENKLYTKIEICNSLSSFGPNAVVPLIRLFGKIGRNQHREISEKDFRKESYPLPRDIVSRIIIRIGSKALPALMPVLEEEDIDILSEAIDAIGFINFYDKRPEVYDHLLNCFHRHSNNNLIKWKIIRAFSGISESGTFLNELLTREKDISMLREIRRSLNLISKR